MRKRWSNSYAQACFDNRFEWSSYNHETGKWHYECPHDQWRINHWWETRARHPNEADSRDGIELETVWRILTLKRGASRLWCREHPEIAWLLDR